MEKKLSVLSIVIVTCISSIYLTREFTSDEYKEKIKNIRVIKDSISEQVNRINTKVDNINKGLVKEIETTKKVIANLKGSSYLRNKEFYKLEKTLNNQLEKLKKHETE